MSEPIRYVDISNYVEETTVDRSYSRTAYDDISIGIGRWQAEMLISHIADEFDIDLAKIEP